MPKYTFKCPECGLEEQQTVPRHIKEVSCCRCAPDKESWMKRQLPKLGGQPDVNETVNEYTGVTWKEGQKEAIDERRAQSYWEVEVPRMVRSGTYSIETMLEMGWVYFNDKEEMIINDQPPNKR
jgi:hypothetical protein